MESEHYSGVAILTASISIHAIRVIPFVRSHCGACIKASSSMPAMFWFFETSFDLGIAARSMEP